MFYRRLFAFAIGLVLLSGLGTATATADERQLELIGVQHTVTATHHQVTSVTRIAPHRFRVRGTTIVTVRTAGSFVFHGVSCAPDNGDFVVESQGRARFSRVVRSTIRQQARVRTRHLASGWASTARAIRRASAVNLKLADQQARERCSTERPTITSTNLDGAQVSLSGGPFQAVVVGSANTVDFSLNDPSIIDNVCPVDNIDKTRRVNGSLVLSFDIDPTEVGECFVAVYGVGGVGNSPTYSFGIRVVE